MFGSSNDGKVVSCSRGAVCDAVIAGVENGRDM